MANIDNELLEICAASDGKYVRSSIASALERINKDRKYPENNYLKITRDDNHKTIEGGPWSRVTVAINEEGEETEVDPVVLDDLGVITANGYYDLWNMNWPAGHGWKSFTVDVPGTEYHSGERTITENGEYVAEYDGYDGYSKVNINVPVGGHEGQKFTVTFYDQWRFPLEKVEVNFGETAVFTRTLPKSDTPFVRWDPEPVNVSYNMDCYPVFYDAGYRGTIKDDWNTIRANMQNGSGKDIYHIGDTRMMPCTGFNREVEMVLVKMDHKLTSHDYKYEYVRRNPYFPYDEDPNGTLSLWISKDALYNSSINPAEVLTDYSHNDCISKKEWFYDKQSMYEYSLHGGADKQYESEKYNETDHPHYRITWNSLSYEWFVIGINWLKLSIGHGKRIYNEYERHDQFPIDYYPHQPPEWWANNYAQRIVGTEAISYDKIRNGGLYELYDICDTMIDLGIWTNKYYDGVSSDGRTVSILLDTYDIESNAPAYYRSGWMDHTSAGPFCAFYDSYDPQKDTYRWKHTGALYSGQAYRPRLSDIYSITASDYSYSGASFCPDPPRESVGQILKHSDGIARDDTGFSREFLII